MTAVVAWATGLPGLFITVPGLMWLAWGVRHEWKRRQQARERRDDFRVVQARRRRLRALDRITRQDD